MKTCPFCAEEIQDAAIKCRYCGESQTSPPPQPISKTIHSIHSRKSANNSFGNRILLWCLAAVVLVLIIMFLPWWTLFISAAALVVLAYVVIQKPSLKAPYFLVFGRPARITTSLIVGRALLFVLILGLSLRVISTRSVYQEGIERAELQFDEAKTLAAEREFIEAAKVLQATLPNLPSDDDLKARFVQQRSLYLAQADTQESQRILKRAEQQILRGELDPAAQTLETARNLNPHDRTTLNKIHSLEQGLVALRDESFMPRYVASLSNDDLNDMLNLQAEPNPSELGGNKLLLSEFIRRFYASTSEFEEIRTNAFKNRRSDLVETKESIANDESSTTADYSLITEERVDTRLLTRVSQHFLVNPDIDESRIRNLLRTLYDKATEIDDFRNNDGRPTAVFVYLYTSIAHYASQDAQWIAMMGKSGGEQTPSIHIKTHTLDTLKEESVIRFEKSEEQRKEIFMELFSVSVRANKEAWAAFPELESTNLSKTERQSLTDKLFLLEEELDKEYEAEIGTKFGLTSEELEAIAIEGMEKNWPRPPYEP